MKNSEKFEKAFNYFKQSYTFKMGGTQTVLLPNGKAKHFDDREFYSGRGVKYNSNINHDSLGVIKVSKKEYSAFLSQLKERENQKALRLKEIAEKEARLLDAKKKGIYTYTEEEHGNYIELSTQEQEERRFDAERLAKTLDICVADAELLNSQGKTYVFAQQISTGKMLELYHPSLSCNRLSIYFGEASEERVASFNHGEWSSAPFAHLLGQTVNSNHFVC